MLKFNENKNIFLACGHTDMRKSINGLAALVKRGFKLDPFNGALFVFCNRSRTVLKILEWDQDGFWLHQKRLELGHFKWPSTNLDKNTMNLNRDEILNLLKGPRLEQKFKGKEISSEVII